jgi:hypothetical protein
MIGLYDIDGQLDTSMVVLCSIVLIVAQLLQDFVVALYHYRWNNIDLPNLWKRLNTLTQLSSAQLPHSVFATVNPIANVDTGDSPSAQVAKNNVEESICHYIVPCLIFSGLLGMSFFSLAMNMDPAYQASNTCDFFNHCIPSPCSQCYNMSVSAFVFQ